MAWTDYIADWSSVDKLRLAAPLNGITPVINAVNERCTVAGVSTINEVSRLGSIAVLSTIQSKITQLIPYFVNHSENGGNFTELSEIPMWTEATILTAIGASTRIDTPQFFLSADWLYQQYQIINKLIWVETSTNSGVTTPGFYGFREGTSIINAVDNAIANIYPSALMGIQNHTRAGLYISGGYFGVAESGEGKFYFSTIKGSSISCSGDIYFLAEKVTGHDPSTSEFDSNGLAVEGLNLFESIPVQQYSSYTTGIIGNKNIFPVYPSEPSAGWQSILGWNTGTAYFVSKFNVPGGFEYVE